MKRFCFALDLKNDQQLIDEYRSYHEKIWPEIKASIIDSGILDMQIYLIENRLFMIMDCQDEFSLEKKSADDLNNKKVQEWESLMWTYQQALPSAKKGEKWLQMEKIFTLND